MIDVRVEDDKLICKPQDNLVASNVKKIIGELKPHLQEQPYTSLEFDLSSCKRVDSMGITLLVGTYKQLLAQNKTMRIVGISREMLRLFRIMKLDEVFDIA